MSHIVTKEIRQKIRESHMGHIVTKETKRKKFDGVFKSMNILMLRGQIPQDRNPNEIVFNKIEDVDDVWTQLLFSMTQPEDQSEIWYWGGTREKRFAPNFTERWLPNFSNNLPKFEPDIIFCRGGFKEYHSVLSKFENVYAYKIYYGAGRRYLPQPGFTDYNLILQDSPEQLKECRKKFPDIKSSLFIKPAPDDLFYPKKVWKKYYDVCFPANGHQKFKGHDFVYSTIPKNLTLMNLGNPFSGAKIPISSISYQVKKSQMADHICKCKMGIVTVDSKIDSCPRVIPEMLACGLPIVVLNTVRCWQEKYIVSGVTGEIATKENFWEVVKKVLKNLNKYEPAKYYQENLSLPIAAQYIKDLLK